MHILILPSWYPKDQRDIGGSFFREQAIALAKSGCQVGVIASALRSLRNPKSALIGPFGLSIENDCGVITFRNHGVDWLSKFFTANVMRLRSWGFEFFEHYRKCYGMPDIIHVHSMLSAGLLARDLSVRFNIPYVVTEHSSAFARGSLSAEKLRLAGVVANHAAARFAVSTPFASLLYSALGDEGCAWEVLPNIIEPRFFSAGPHVATAACRRNDRFVFLTVSYLKPQKRIDLLVSSFAHAFKGRNDVVLRIGGDGPERSALEAQVESLGLTRQVVFLGGLERDHVVREMTFCDAFVLSSQYETFGVVLAEALACGKPIVSTRCGGPQDIVTAADGILVPVDNVDALADAMQEIFRNIEAYDAKGISERAYKRFSEAAVVEQLKYAYRKVIQDLSRFSSLEN